MQVSIYANRQMAKLLNLVILQYESLIRSSGFEALVNCGGDVDAS